MRRGFVAQAGMPGRNAYATSLLKPLCYNVLLFGDRTLRRLVQYVIAGHLHQMLRFDLEGVTYLSMASSGGHLRGSQDYRAGWFFGHALVEVRGTDIRFEIEELKPPHGAGRVTKPTDWGTLGLLEKRTGAAGGAVR